MPPTGPRTRRHRPAGGSRSGQQSRLVQCHGVIDTEKVAVLEAALELTDDDSPERALLLATLCNELSFGPLEQRRVLADDAKAMARRSSDPATLTRVLCLVDNPLQIPSALGERMANATEAVASAEVLGDPETLYHALSNRQVNAMQAGDFDLAARCLESLRMLSEQSAATDADVDDGVQGGG